MNAGFIPRAAAVAAMALLAAPSARVTAQQLPEGSKSIFVSVLDASGNPVKDMTPDEFAVREDGKDREMVGIRPAVDPLQLVVLVDTSDSAMRLTQDIHGAIMTFIKQVHAVRNDAAIELMEFGQAPVATPFMTSDVDLEKALSKMVPKPTADAVLLEAIAQANQDLAKRPSKRRAIVSLNVEPSNEQLGNPKRVSDTFSKSSAELWSLSLQAQGLSIGAASSKAGYEDVSNANAGRTSAAANAANITAVRNALLQQLSKASGGERNMIDAQAAMAGILKQWADDLSYQYEVIYRRPSGSAKVVQIGTTRKGVKLHASGFAPE